MQRYFPALPSGVSIPEQLCAETFSRLPVFPQGFLTGHPQMPGFRRAFEQES
jgi:hypothetical protein